MQTAEVRSGRKLTPGQARKLARIRQELEWIIRTRTAVGLSANGERRYRELCRLEKEILGLPG